MCSKRTAEGAKTIVASGTFDTLLETSLAFQELWQHYSKETV
jgi:hypothetical protein